MERRVKTIIDKKRVTAFMLCTVIAVGLNLPTVVYAKDDNGKIDLYEVFSSKEDRLKTEVGSRIYKWSMHLPDDGVIYKSDKANYFNMSTTSYQTTIQLQVEKNEGDLTIEELLYKMQNNKPKEFFNFPGNGDKEYVEDIATDEAGQKYIRIIKSSQIYDYFLVNSAAEELGNYIENRIYIANNYIYNITVNMEGKYYRQHQEMFDKLVSSFKLSYDEKNPYIKELSDSVSSTREFKNASYGYKITMSPYWRVEGTPNSRIQSFSPVYSDEELNIDKNAPKKDEDAFKVNEGIVVSLVSSAEKDETVAKWAAKELEELKNNYNSETYEVLKNETSIQGGTNVQNVVIRYKTVTNNPYIVHNLYVIGNGYKYLISATMKEEKYNDASKKSEFENMLNSFTLDKDSISKYLGEILSASSIVDLNSPKEFKLKKYDFTTKLTKDFSTPENGYGLDYNQFYGRTFYPGDNRGNISNNEAINIIEAASNIQVTISAGLDTNEIDEAVKLRASDLLKNDEVRMGLAKVNIQSAEYEGAQLYCIQKEYDLDAINKFVKEDQTKIYDLTKLQNQYEYIIKIGKDTYNESVTLPVANNTVNNKAKIESVWNNTVIKQKNYSLLKIDWKQRTLDEFNSDSTKK